MLGANEFEPSCQRLLQSLFDEQRRRSGDDHLELMRLVIPKFLEDLGPPLNFLNFIDGENAVFVLQGPLPPLLDDGMGQGGGIVGGLIDPAPLQGRLERGGLSNLPRPDDHLDERLWFPQTLGNDGNETSILHISQGVMLYITKYKIYFT